MPGGGYAVKRKPKKNINLTVSFEALFPVSECG
jgi:hypothetical protein